MSVHRFPAWYGRISLLNYKGKRIYAERHPSESSSHVPRNYVKRRQSCQMLMIAWCRSESWLYMPVQLEVFKSSSSQRRDKCLAQCCIIPFAPVSALQYKAKKKKIQKMRRKMRSRSHMRSPRRPPQTSKAGSRSIFWTQ